MPVSKHITTRILRRVHPANVAGTSLPTLAKVNNVSLSALKTSLKSYREIHRLMGPVSAKELFNAARRVGGASPDTAHNQCEEMTGGDR